MAQTGSIYLSYRRDESRVVAGWLFDRLSTEFGQDRVFMDVDSIAPSLTFTEAVQQAVCNCRVLLVIIGQGWTNAHNSEGHRCLEDPHDRVRFEVETALSREGVRVVPVLTDDAPMPRGEELPGGLARLSHCQAVEIISTATTSQDVERLIDSLKTIIGSPDPERPPSEHAHASPGTSRTRRLLTAVLARAGLHGNLDAGQQGRYGNADSSETE